MRRIQEELEHQDKMQSVTKLRSTIGVTDMQIKRSLVKTSKFVKLDKSFMK